MENNEIIQRTKPQQKQSLLSQRAPLMSAASSSNSNNNSNGARPPQHNLGHSIPIIPTSASQAFALNFEHQFNETETQRTCSYLANDPVTKNSLETTFECLGKSLDEANKNNRYLVWLLQSEKSKLETFKENEMFLRKMLGELQQKYMQKEQENLKLQSDLETLENNPESVLKVEYEEVLEQNKTIAANNELISQQNDELRKKGKEQQKHLLKLQDENEKIFGENEILQEELYGMENQLSQQIENVDKLEAKLESQKGEVKTLKGTLALAENRHKNEVQQLKTKVSEMNTEILEGIGKLNSSNKQVNSLMNENVILANKIERLKEERIEEKSLTAKSKEISRLAKLLNYARIALKKRNESVERLQGELEKLKKTSESELGYLKQQLKSECERSRQANMKLFDQKMEIKNMRKQNDELKAQMERKSKGLESLKRLSAGVEKEKIEANSLANKLIMDAAILKLDNECLNNQLKLRLDELRKLQSERNLLRKEVCGLNEVVKEVEQRKEELQRKLKENLAHLQTREAELTEKNSVIDSQKGSLDEWESKILELEQELEPLHEKVNEEKLRPHSEELNYRNYLWFSEFSMNLMKLQPKNTGLSKETRSRNLQLEEISSEDELFEETPAKRWKST